MFWIVGAVLAAVALLLLGSYIWYRMAFYASRKNEDPEAIKLPKGEIYEPFHPRMEKWIHHIRSLPNEDLYITSFDGLSLHARYFEFAPGAPVELLFHGYRGSAEGDMAGGVMRCFRLGRSALLVDQRCAGLSGGKTITFGVREHRDCLDWAGLMARRFPDSKLILTGISMGAATVMMAADKDLPENVVGILADCGYTSAEAIIKKVIAQIGLPVVPGYFLVKLGARVFGGFDLEAAPPTETLKNARVPVIFFHGEADDFVPCAMSVENFALCASTKKLVTVPGAGHGLSYPVAPEEYLAALRDFFPDYTPIK